MYKIDTESLYEDFYKYKDFRLIWLRLKDRPNTYLTSTTIEKIQNIAIMEIT